MRHTKADIRLAYHESGHAIMALILGVPVASVTLDHAVRINGRASSKTEGLCVFKRGYSCSWDSAVMIGCAGQIAQHVLGDMRKLYSGAFQDLDDINKILDKRFDDKKVRQENMWRLQDQCESFMRDYWKEVQALANALLERRRLTGEEVLQVLERCGTEIALTFGQGTAQKFQGRKK